MLQYPGVIPADGMVFRQCVFGYGRFVSEAFDACVLMLLQMCFQLTLSPANVHLSTGAWYFVDDVYLLLCREGVLDLRKE